MTNENETDNGESQANDPASFQDDFAALLDGSLTQEDDLLGEDEISNLLNGEAAFSDIEKRVESQATSNGGDEESETGDESGTATDETTGEEAESETELETETAGDETESDQEEETPETGEEQAVEDPQIAALKAQVETLSQALEGLNTQTQEAKQTQTQAEAERAAAQLTQYNFQIPEPVLQALDSEDPADRQRGITHLLNGVAHTVHTRVRQELQAVQQIFPEYASQAVSAHLQRQAIREDFYTEFPQLNKKEFVETVKTTIQTVMAEDKVTEWTPQVRDKAGKRVLTALGLTASKGGKTPTVQRKKPAGKPPASMQTGKSGGAAPVARPSARKTVSAQVQDLL